MLPVRIRPTKLQSVVVPLLALVLLVSLFYPGYLGIKQMEGAAALLAGEFAEGDEEVFGNNLLNRFLLASGTFWRQIMASALPKSVYQSQHLPASGGWSSTMASLLYQMRVSTPTTFLALGIPVLRNVSMPDPDEVLLPANEPPVPPLVAAEEPPSPEAEALGWRFVPEMLVYHTHNIESFVPTSGKQHVYDNPEQTIVRVGAKLAEHLANAGVDVIHSTADNSSKNYTLAYSQSLKTVTSILEQKPSIEYAFDLHRDGGLPRTATTTVVEGQSTARIYIVVGTNTTLGHPNYRQNIAFATQLNNKLNELYPGLSRGVRVTDRSRYNQHVREKALLIEVGSDKNTMDEALRAVRFLAEAIVAVAKDLQP